MMRLLPIILRCLCVVAFASLPNVTSLAILRLSNNVQKPAHRVAPQFRHVARPLTTSLRNDLRDEIEKAAQRRAYENRSQGGGTGETVGGAILGGMLGGPFGALFGAQIGASLGARSQLSEARKEEMRKKGLTPDMLEQATEIGVALNQAVEGLRATQESVETSQKLAKTLDRQETSLYDKAKTAIQSGEEEVARKLLLERESVREKLLKILKSVAEERKRLAQMESNVEALQTRGLEIESLLRRSVSVGASADLGFSLEAEDPLLKKFRDLGM
ncbi:hypothetical protein ACHAXR_008226 [Thalassiosira sp. AJA248-18]